MDEETLKLIREATSTTSVPRPSSRRFRSGSWSSRAKVKRLLRRFGYPPDRQPEAIERVLKQTEVRAEEWA
ncbi:type I restriction enzyme endonuclease domain-containing protein [Streptomyces sp. BRA346]|uniref:type I restriction enzyme endonuclease domain-containing protein n=1 Tax=Streptomyces sp. BRA346 TaxID=2878199 RepID=UPI0040643E69